jgi:hypothetical protein
MTNVRLPKGVCAVVASVMHGSTTGCSSQFQKPKHRAAYAHAITVERQGRAASLRSGLLCCHSCPRFHEPLLVQFGLPLGIPECGLSR